MQKNNGPNGIPFKLIKISGVNDIVLVYVQRELESNLNSTEPIYILIFAVLNALL